jgi:flavin reductase (DIM6/NTAB) family NADH-FMN oxidoreductase RutF
MNVRHAREVLKSFVTGVSLITTSGSLGANVSAAEWTYVVSYNPFLLSVHLNPLEATHETIVKRREFGVNVVSERQVRQMEVAGNFSRYRTHKLSSSLFRVFPAALIDVPMISGARLNAECRLFKAVRLGDHTAFIGEVLSFHVKQKARPLAYRQGPYRLGSRIRRKAGLSIAVTPAHHLGRSVLAIDGLLTLPLNSSTPLTVELHGSGGQSAILHRVLRPNSRTFHFDVPIAPPGLSRRWQVTAEVRGLRGRATIASRDGNWAEYDSSEKRALKADRVRSRGAQSDREHGRRR